MMAEHLTHPALAGFRHGYFTRRGGVSSGAYESLNCGERGDDLPTNVAANRERVRLAMGATALCGLRQVHGARCVVAQPGTREEADALVSATPGLAIGIVTADCAPVLFADTQARVVGAAHAGWRGAVAGVLEATVAAMVALGAQPMRITTVIGPCIAQPSYEVGAELRDAVGEGCFFTPGRDAARFQFDLAGYCAARLAGMGVVATMGLDTRDDTARFFSHRRRTLAGGGPLGHQISVIVA